MDIVTASVVLPDFFSLDVRSIYGRLARLAFFEAPQWRDELVETLRSLEMMPEAYGATQFSQETIKFHVGEQRVGVDVDVSANNQVLGADRSIRTFRHGYEPEIHCAIDILTKPDATIVDVGSNWGPITFQAALRPGFVGKIVCFEPQASALAMLEKAVGEIGLQARIFCHNLALSDSAGEATLSRHFWSGNRMVTKDGGGEKCRMDRLDRVLHNDPDIIKIDVEGYESRVLAGAAETLRRCRPLIIFEDFVGCEASHYAQLGKLGYSFYALGWYQPFTDLFSFSPPLCGDIQVLAFKPFKLSERAEFAERINVLASAKPLG
ncbi:MAG: FkbM family methyltransferase [Betaproteobacteria bacterium]|nr:FkbM family methyltransferase [Betaproteobacteria bacterium]